MPMDQSSSSDPAQPAVSATQAIVDQIIDQYRDERGVNAETAIGALGSLCGEWVQRSAGITPPERGWIAGDVLNEALLEGPDNACDELKAIVVEAKLLTEADYPDSLEVLKRTVEAFGSSPFPPLTIPRDFFPSEWSPAANVRLRPGIEAIAAERGLDARQALQALLTATASMINMAKTALPPVLTTQLAVEMMVGVAHMVPIREGDGL